MVAPRFQAAAPGPRPPRLAVAEPEGAGLTSAHGDSVRVTGTRVP